VVSALCSPTRAAIITGRNHHSVGFGVISEQATPVDDADYHVPFDFTGTIDKLTVALEP
jgi:arylsulfatase A-like enzyme